VTTKYYVRHPITNNVNLFSCQYDSFMQEKPAPNS
jgi:hypothetical protein